GSNVELVERFPLFSSEDRYMFIGADVNHPAASNTLSPSVAAVVGSINWPAATRYAARVSPQKHRKEEIVNFGSFHFGGIGTSKPTHYSVIWDENKFSSDEMQKLVYHLCYIFARCTKPVSLVPPVYYADLVAYRGRMFQ
nr:protein argonaute 2 [Tanacetum cinerariifolium]